MLLKHFAGNIFNVGLLLAAEHFYALVFYLSKYSQYLLHRCVTRQKEKYLKCHIIQTPAQHESAYHL